MTAGRSENLKLLGIDEAPLAKKARKEQARSLAESIGTMFSRNSVLKLSNPNFGFTATIYGKANDGAIYDPLSKKWYHPPMPALPTELLVFPVASAGGLICFLDSAYITCYVCNPLTASFKELPARSVDFGAIGMTVNVGSANHWI
ncbi:F-box only protein 6-like [Forsythia ovata]|uniref:F-box only protein 6-like n=1 Tax=Forsythia ovata TaxID=205694 RepID=A0ABD1TC88_9LAMI